MTLTTTIRVVDPTPIDPLWREGQRLIGDPYRRSRSYDLHRGDSRYPGSQMTVQNNERHNEPGQGYHALYWIEWGADGMLDDNDYQSDTGLSTVIYTKHESSECQGDVHKCDPDASIEIKFDTPYGYHTVTGAGSHDLHAWLVQEMGKWLDARGLRWYWYDEYRGQWHPSTDPVTTLGDPEIGEPPPLPPRPSDQGFEFMLVSPNVQPPTMEARGFA